MKKIKIKMHQKCNDLIPKKNHPTDAGFDLKARCVWEFNNTHKKEMEINILDHDFELKPNSRCLIGTAAHLELPNGYEAQVRPRSGLANKYGITIVNSPGTVDAESNVQMRQPIKHRMAIQKTKL